MGGLEKFSVGLKKAVHRLARRFEQENGESFFGVSVEAPTRSYCATKSDRLDELVAVGSSTGEDDLL